MVPVPAADQVHVQRGAGVHRECPPPLLQRPRVERADRPAERHVVGEVRPLAEVDHRAGQGLVERRVRVREAGDSGAVAQGARERLAEHDACVLDQVVLVHVQVAGAAQPQVEAAVPGDLLHHVVQEPEAGLDRDLAPSVEPYLALELRLPALPVYPSYPFDHSFLTSMAYAWAVRRSIRASATAGSRSAPSPAASTRATLVRFRNV